MSYNYLDNSFYQITELRDSHITIFENFEDFESLVDYKWITLRNWNKSYPLPSLPNNVLVLEILCDYIYPLNDLPLSIEVLIIEYSLKYPLLNLPSSLYQLEFINHYQFNIDLLPESIKILNLSGCWNQISRNLLPRLKSLTITNNTFNDRIVFPSNLEELNLSEYKINNYNEMNKLNMLELPITLKILYLPEINIVNTFNIDEVLFRLINLETLYTSKQSKNIITEFPSKLKKLILGNNFNQILVNIPDTLKYLELPYLYNQSLENLVNSKIEHIYLNDNTEISILKHIPKNLKKLSISESHNELFQVKNKYKNIEIEVLPDYDYQEKQFVNFIIDMKYY
jgi:hypothetical protein